jgi:diamine N-acetyltransferase
MTVRTATPADADLVHRLAVETFPDACPPGTPDDDIRAVLQGTLGPAAIARYLVDPGRRVLLLTDPADEPLGYAMLVDGDPDDPDVAGAVRSRPTIELSKFYLRERARGTGVADELMAAVVAAAASSRARSLWLGCSSVNERANRFYERVGFSVVGARSFALGSRVERDHVRERPLAAVSPRRP